MKEFNSFQGVSFFSVIMKSCQDNLWYAWIYVLGCPQTALEYTCEIKLHNLSDSEESLTFRGKPHSLDKSSKEIIQGSGTLAMTDCLVKKMRKEMSKDEKKNYEKEKFKYLLCIMYKVEQLEKIC